MNQEQLSMIAMESALESAGHKFPKLSVLAQKSGKTKDEFPILIETNTDSYGMAVLDVTIDTKGQVRLIEANGSNSGLTSVSMGSDEVRVHHILSILKTRTQKTFPSVVLFPFKPGFMHLAEFYSRANLLAARLSKENSVTIRNAGEELTDDDFTLVCGRVPEIAERMEYKNNEFLFEGREVVFASNPNLLPELTRLGIDNSDKKYKDQAEKIFHDGPLLYTTHDKSEQQKVAEGTGIEPIYSEECWSLDECVHSIRKFHNKGLVAVAKMNAGSGAAGIGFFPKDLSLKQIEEKAYSLLHEAISTYGQNAQRTVFPIRVFEFVQSTPYILDRQSHLWDIRMQCLVSPGVTDVLPSLIRICPAPFDGVDFSWDSVVSNLTGRPPSLDYVRTAFDEAALGNLNIDLILLQEIARKCAMWCESAWRAALTAKRMRE